MQLSRVGLFVTLWTVAHRAPLSIGFSRQELLEWVAISFSRVGNLPHPVLSSVLVRGVSQRHSN